MLPSRCSIDNSQSIQLTSKLLMLPDSTFSHLLQPLVSSTSSSEHAGSYAEDIDLFVESEAMAKSPEYGYGVNTGLN